MNKRKIIERTATYVRKELSGEGSGHDWWHVYRVWKNAQHIGRGERVDMFVVETAALLHDIADWKLHGGDEDVGPSTAGRWLRKQKVDETTIRHVQTIIRGLSFKGAKAKIAKLSIEGQVVQDADRLDAIGAIGVARAFAYGGFQKRPMHDPDEKPVQHTSSQAYKKTYQNKGGTTINHFYEKLLLLKERMNTKTAKRIAQRRHLYLKTFLKEFYWEWDGKK